MGVPPLPAFLPDIRSTLPLLPLFAQSWLLTGQQTPSRRLLRAALGVFATYLCLRAPYDYYLRPPERYVVLNLAGGVSAAYGALRAIEWAVVPGPCRWVGLDRDVASPTALPRGVEHFQHAISQLFRCVCARHGGRIADDWQHARHWLGLRRPTGSAASGASSADDPIPARHGVAHHLLPRRHHPVCVRFDVILACDT